MKISVIICAYNPRKFFFERTLESLKSQTLETEKWEFLIIDNNSSNNVIDECDLSWHPRAQIMIETKPGLTSARVRGIRESQGEILVFVDDDNVLDEHYLSTAIKIGQEHSDLGVWGSARIMPEFETQPSEVLLPHTNVLALRDQKSDHIGTDPQDWSQTPYGAGLCCRRSVAAAVIECFMNHKIISLLGRNGQMLLSGEDIQFSYESVKLGMKIGIFPSLSLLHLIPSFRVQDRYLRECIRGHSTSEVLLGYANLGRRGWSLRRKLRFVREFLVGGNLDKQFLAEYFCGMLAGINMIDQIEKNK